MFISCLAEIDAAGLEPLLSILKQIDLPSFGSHHHSNSKNIAKYLANIKKTINYDTLFVTSVESDPKNRTINRITLAKPSDMHMFPV